MSDLAPIGIIEGFYGEPWSWAARAEQVSFLQPHGLEFYMYAPKADAFLRKRWREPHPDDQAQALSDFAAHCRKNGVRFGVGLSPFELYRDFNAQAQADLAAKLRHLESLGIDELGVLFDDMRGDLPGLAETQIRIVHWIAERTSVKRLIMCGTYYSDDPSLDSAFGVRPPGYLEALGAGLAPEIGVFWTGEEVCSREYSAAHLARVGDALRRKPVLWDNYPVNDGPRMSHYLFIRSVTGRPSSIRPHLAAHAVNPALQPVLSRIPILSLAESYSKGDDYQYLGAFNRASEAVLGQDLANKVQRHLVYLNDFGLENLGETAAALRARYAAYDHPGSREIVDWLDGRWRMSREMMDHG